MKTVTRSYCFNHPNARALRRGLCGACYQKLGETGALLGVADPPPKRPKKPRKPRPKPQQTHCRVGHEMTDENTVLYGTHWECRECSRVRVRKYRHKNRDAAVQRIKLLVEAGCTYQQIADLLDVPNPQLVEKWINDVSLLRVSAAKARVWTADLDEALTNMGAA